jgi:hypothetical protein
MELILCAISLYFWLADHYLLVVNTNDDDDVMIMYYVNIIYCYN